MAEYIEREAALSSQNKSMNLAEMRKRLERIPAADVRPVVRGKWEEVEIEHAENIDLYPDLVTMRCGKCNRYHTTLFFYGNPTALMNFCPVCGADMREGS